MENLYRTWRVFVACPSELTKERDRLELVIGELQALARYSGVILELIDWRNVAPDCGLAEEVILDQLKPTEWDIFIGILWHRFGSATGSSRSGQPYLSGTEEEFELAWQLWDKHKRPHILFYHCQRLVRPDDIDPNQLQLVANFLSQFRPGGKHPGLVASFHSTIGFERLVRRHLQSLLGKEFEKREGRKINAAEVQIMAPALENLPSRDKFFVGRDSEITIAMKALSPEIQCWGLVIDGIGGIGKTALAVEVAHRCRDAGLYRRFIFVSAKLQELTAEGIRNVLDVRDATLTLDEFANETARWLGQSAIMEMIGDRKIDALLTSLRGSHALLIYDNLEVLEVAEQDAVLNLLQRLPPGCRALATTRQCPTGAMPLRLSKLDWPQAFELIQSKLTSDPERRIHLSVPADQWHELYEAVGGAPLALIWALGLLGAHAESFYNVLTLLRIGGDPCIDLHQFIYGKARAKLNANELRTLHALSLFSPSATFSAVHSVTQLPRHALEASLNRLSAFSLVDGAPSFEQCTLHPLTRNYAAADLKNEPNAARLLGVGFAKHWLKYAWSYGGYKKDQYKTFPMLRAEWANIRNACDWLWALVSEDNIGIDGAEIADLLNEFAQALGGFLVYSGRWDYRIELSERAYEAQKELNKWQQAAWRAYDVAWIQYYRANSDETERWTTKCRQAFEHSQGKLEHAITLRLQGLCGWLRGNHDEAQRQLGDALKITVELDNSEEIGRLHSDLGALATECNDLDMAESHHTEALKRLNGVKDSEGVARCYINLGYVSLGRRQWTRAKENFEKGLELATEIERLNLKAQAYFGMACVDEGMDKREQAIDMALKALKIYDQLKHRNRNAARELIRRLNAGERPPSIYFG